MMRESSTSLAKRIAVAPRLSALSGTNNVELVSVHDQVYWCILIDLYLYIHKQYK